MHNLVAVSLTQYVMHCYAFTGHSTSQFWATLSTVTTVLSGHSKGTPKIGFQYQLSLNAGKKYCRMLLSTFMKVLFSTNTFVLDIVKWPLKTGFTVFIVFIRLPRHCQWSGLILTANQQFDPL